MRGHRLKFRMAPSEGAPPRACWISAVVGDKQREKKPFYSKFKHLNQVVRINVSIHYTVLTYTTNGWFRILITVAIYVNTFFKSWKHEKRATDK